MMHWHALYTKPRKERQVCDLLEKRGFEVYLPQLRLLKKRRLVQTSQPLFPCYLFVRTDIKKVGISALSWTLGLRKVVSFCGEPGIVDEDVIDHIKLRLAEGNGPEIYGRFKKGDRVTITNGPFRDLDAVFDARMSGSNRVRVLLRLMGQATPCEVDDAWLEKVA
jgi:transcriptional antiterminator RfaH